MTRWPSSASVDEVIRQVEHAFPDLTIIVRGDRVAIVSHSKSTESQASRAEDVIHTIIQAAYSAPMDADTVRRLLDQDVLPNKARAEHPGYGRFAEREGASLGAARSGDARKPRIPGVITFAVGQPVRAKTAGQIAYVNAVDAHTITFAIGLPARARPTSPWPRRCARSRTGVFAASS